MEHARLLSVGRPIVEQVLLCDLYRRTQPPYQRVSTSLPGHLLQLTVEGQTAHEVEGRRYTLRPGSLIWYHEDELVRLHVRQMPWSFYTLNFIATALEPPPFDQRVHRVDRAVCQQFETLLQAWRDVDRPGAERELRVHGELSRLLAMLFARIGPRKAEPFRMDAETRLWWELEAKVRQRLDDRITLSALEAWTGRSRATIARACHAALGQPPMRRVRHLRLNLARGLVRRSAMTITEIAGRVGYERLHEFSRDYRRQYGLSARDDRQTTRSGV